MITRIRPGRVLDLARRDLPAPADVVNLITPSSSFEPYRWYGILVLPALLAVGARPLWMGRLQRALAGEPQAEKLLIVRYPSHRRFLAMTVNPYYLAINRLREAGVDRFEAAFTHASTADADLARRRNLVGAHFNSLPGASAHAAVKELFEGAGHELVYATATTAPIEFLEPALPTDPNPLTLGELALFAPPDEGAEPLDPLVPKQLAELTREFAVHRYERESRRAYRPSLPLIPREAS